MKEILENGTKENPHSLVNEDAKGENIPLLVPIFNIEQAERADAFMKELFGDGYDSIKEIFYRLCISEEFQYKILVTRRAYLLYEIFASIFQLCQEKRPDSSRIFEIKGEVYNSHSLDSIEVSNNNSEKNYLIFDDIIVHGRAINNTIQKLLDKKIALDRISVWCLLEKEPANCLKEEYQNRILVYKLCNEEVWKTFSDDLTALVTRYARGYTSYIDTYVLSDIEGGKLNRYFSRLLDSFKNNKNFIVSDNYSTDGTDINAFIVFDANQPITKDSYDVGCVRFYKYDDCILGIPYLFIRTVREEDAFPYACQLLKKYGVDQIPSGFFNREKSQPILKLSALFLKWTVNTVGRRLIEQFLGETDFSVEKTIKRTETFYKIDESDLIPLPDYKCCVDFQDTTDNNDIQFCRRILANSFSESYQLLFQNNLSDSVFESKKLFKLIQCALVTYAYKIKEKDEERSNSQEDRFIGLRTTDVIEICISFLSVKSVATKDSGHNLIMNATREVISLFIQNWDCGTSAYDFIIFKDKNGKAMLSAFIKNGEQVFRSLYEYFEEIYQYYYAYSARTLVTDIDKLSKYGEYLEVKLSKDLQKQVKVFNNYLKMNSSYYADVYVVEPFLLSEQAFKTADQYLLECSP